jgi:hypothetical protein
VGYKNVKVYCYDKQGNYLNDFPSLTSASKAVNSYASNISRSIKMKILCNNFYFDIKKHETYPIKKYRRGGHRIAFRHISKRTWESCETISEAVERTGAPSSSIRRVLKSRNNFYAKGEYYFKSLGKDVIPKTYKRLSENIKIPIQVIKNNESLKFNSITEASKKLITNRTGIIFALRGVYNNRKYKQTNGYVILKGNYEAQNDERH